MGDEKVDTVERKQEKLGETLRRLSSAGKSARAGPSTPVSSWRLEGSKGAHDSKAISTHIQAHSNPSARKLAATLWEFPPFDRMHRGDNGHYRPTLSNLHEDKGFDFGSSFAADPSPRHPDQMTSFNPAATPPSSLELKRRNGVSSSNLKTSTELLNLLNRIWSLEEKHASNISLVKALKTEVEHGHARTIELIRRQQADKREKDELRRQIKADKLARKSREQERISAATQSVRTELEGERRLRKRSESLHRKLAQEVFEAKSSLSSTLKELEQERKSRKLLEDLSDEFAKAIKEYEQEVHALKQRGEKDRTIKPADQDRRILHISESWLDERMQMKQRKPSRCPEGENSIVDKLSTEIESFLRAKRTASSKKTDNGARRDDTVRNSLRRRSVESVTLNEAGTAFEEVIDEDSTVSDLHCFALNKQNGAEYPIEEGGNMCMEYGEGSCSNSTWRNRASPVQHTKSGVTYTDACRSSSKHASFIKNTLKAKLVEARSKGQLA